VTASGAGGDAPGRWYAAGDVNAFFGLAVDNLTNLVVLAGLLVGVFGFPADLVLYRMVPGTALGVLAGDLWYTWLARRLARETGRTDVTAMPFGIDTPSLFGITFGVLGPTMLATRDPALAWKVGMGVTVAMGVAKLLLAFVPTVAALVTIELTAILGSLGLGPGALRGQAAATVETLRLLGNGFILAAAAFLAVASLGSLCGVIHSPLASGRALLAGWKRNGLAGTPGRGLRPPGWRARAPRALGGGRGQPCRQRRGHPRLTPATLR
jgi:hypothetical protein